MLADKMCWPEFFSLCSGTIGVWDRKSGLRVASGGGYWNDSSPPEDVPVLAGWPSAFPS